MCQVSGPCCSLLLPAAETYSFLESLLLFFNIFENGKKLIETDAVDSLPKVNCINDSASVSYYWRLLIKKHQLVYQWNIKEAMHCDHKNNFSPFLPLSITVGNLESVLVSFD